MKHLHTFESFLNEAKDPKRLEQNIEFLRDQLAEYQEKIERGKKGIAKRKSEMRDTDPGDQDALKQFIAKSESDLYSYERSVRNLKQAIERTQQELAAIQK